MEVFLGNEEEASRYVLLVDCNHVIESEGLEGWLRQDPDTIKFKECPKCKTAIKKTHRFNEFVKKAIRDVASVKVKLFGTEEDNKRHAQELLQKLMAVKVKTGILSLCK